MKNNFEKNGFLIIKNAINKDLLFKLKRIVTGSKKTNYRSFILKLKNNKKKLYDFVEQFHNVYLFQDIYKKILIRPKVYGSLTNLLGNDLAHHEDPSLTINVSNLNNSKKNYLFKKWHQEMWSGASTSTIAVWTPIFQPKSNQGQIEFIPGSHLWGHIPHKNREPINLPKEFKVYKTNINEGDVILFHSLLLHKTSMFNSNTYEARLALITHVRNFKNFNISYDNNKSWRIFSLSDLTKIEKKLGNHYLSPFRLLNH
tara:strand:+ start:1291 stop:2061 length:771 start_codon:yes stop_codon:yes gene_type:complete